ncbi:hypothetical protein FRB95_007741 [Tulasnella sp. JGI-2019a]|nr:hypothetical protein FRB95_007741 [Tulasnella sp. JGI-2019a]
MTSSSLNDRSELFEPVAVAQEEPSDYDGTTEPSRKRKISATSSTKEIEEYLQQNSRLKTSHASDVTSLSGGSDQQTPSPIRDTSPSDDTTLSNDTGSDDEQGSHAAAGTPTSEAKRRAFEDLSSIRSVLPSANLWALVREHGAGETPLVDYSSSVGDSEHGNQVMGEGDGWMPRAEPIVHLEIDRLQEIHHPADPWPLIRQKQPAGDPEETDSEVRDVNIAVDQSILGRELGPATESGELHVKSAPYKPTNAAEEPLTLATSKIIAALSELPPVIAEDPRTRSLIPELSRLQGLPPSTRDASFEATPCIPTELVSSAQFSAPLAPSPSPSPEPYTIRRPVSEEHALQQKIAAIEMKRLLASSKPARTNGLIDPHDYVDWSQLSGPLGAPKAESHRRIESGPSALFAEDRSGDVGSELDAIGEPEDVYDEAYLLTGKDATNPLASISNVGEGGDTAHICIEPPRSAEVKLSSRPTLIPNDKIRGVENEANSLGEVGSFAETSSGAQTRSSDEMSLSVLLQLQQAERRSTRLVCRKDTPTRSARGPTAKPSKVKRKSVTVGGPASDSATRMDVDDDDIVPIPSKQTPASSSKTSKRKRRPKAPLSTAEYEVQAAPPQSEKDDAAGSLGHLSVPAYGSEPHATTYHACTASASYTVEDFVPSLCMMTSTTDSSPSKSADTILSLAPSSPLVDVSVPTIQKLSPTPKKPLPSRLDVMSGDMEFDDSSTVVLPSRRPQRKRAKPAWLANYSEHLSDYSPEPEPGPSNLKRPSDSALDTSDGRTKHKRQKKAIPIGPFTPTELVQSSESLGSLRSSSRSHSRSPASVSQREGLPASDLASKPSGSSAEPFVQQKTCIGSTFRGGSFQCHACVRRKGGDMCRFSWIRKFLGGGSQRHPIGPHEFVNDERTADLPIYPTHWNVKPTEAQRGRILTVVAKELLPVFEAELKHISQPHVITRIRELDFRITCDYCMTSIFTESWMCHDCGREFCLACRDEVVRVTALSSPEEVISRPEYLKYTRVNDDKVRSEGRLMYCNKSAGHHSQLFKPVTRFQASELEELIKRMKDTMARNSDLGVLPPAVPAVPPPQIHREISDPEDLSGVASQPYHVFRAGDLTDDTFKYLWAQGQTMVVTGLLEKFQLEWTPEALIERYGEQECEVVECQTQVVRKTTVGTFFRQFGVYEGRTDCLKLKDWPPTDEFSRAFPELFQDFAQAVPVPDFTRRDGILNIASHFPTNEKAVVPDIGPKMYNAFESSEMPGGKGSTRLHMDMADAINIMLYASPRQDGSPGTAVWDLFRAEDAAALRKFLYDKYGAINTDPIHSQFYYLDADLRKELFEQEGVTSWRVYQKPGDAVFIPAGCAHQVCNLADCIKVAVDFVSPENIDRCEGLTREFREQNQSMAWKDDVLQLRQTMFHAWNSMSNFTETTDGPSRSQGVL